MTSDTRSLAAYRAELSSVPERLFDLCANAGVRRAIAALARRIREGSGVTFFGMASSQWAAWPAYCLLRGRLPAVNWFSSYEGLIDQPQLDERHTIVLISQSGETVETVRLRDQLAQSGTSAHVAVLTNRPSSTLTVGINDVIDISAGEENHAPTKSYVNSVALLLMLAFDVLEAPAQWAQQLHLAACALPAYLAESEKWGAEVAGAAANAKRHICFLAQGPQMASAWQSTMLCAETVHYSSAALDWATFRHGFEPQIDAAFFGVGFAPGEASGGPAVWRTTRKSILERGGSLKMTPSIQMPQAISASPYGDALAAVWNTLPIHLLFIPLGERLGGDASQIERKVTSDL